MKLLALLAAFLVTLSLAKTTLLINAPASDQVCEPGFGTAVNNTIGCGEATITESVLTAGSGTADCDTLSCCKLTVYASGNCCNCPNGACSYSITVTNSCGANPPVVTGSLAGVNCSGTAPDSTLKANCGRGAEVTILIGGDTYIRRLRCECSPQ